MRGVIAALVALFVLTGVAGATEHDRPRLVKDINPGGRSGIDPFFSGRREGGPFARLGDTIFFWAFDGEHGNELWRSDGTRAGTSLVKDIRPGPRSGRVWSNTTIVRAGRRLFFIANDGTSGAELWTSDGSARGTIRVTDLNPGPGNGDYLEKAAFNRRLLFSAGTPETGVELWRSDGSQRGTSIVKDISPGESGAHPAGITVLGDSAYFAAEHPKSGRELWRTDGTRAGTTLVADINPGEGWSSPEGLTKAGRVLFFRAASEICCDASPNFSRNDELWKSDGTRSGTTMVKDIYPGHRGSSPAGFTAIGDLMLFTAFDPLSGRELWRSDGTPDGTMLVEDIFPGPHPYECLPPLLGCFESVRGLTPMGDIAFFDAEHSPNGAELWMTDGTPSGTTMVEDIRAGLLAGAFPSELTSVGRTLYFSADDGTTGIEPWCSGGSADTTGLVAEIHRTGGDSYPFGFTRAGKRLLFAADDGAHGYELHVLTITRSGGAPPGGCG